MLFFFQLGLGRIVYKFDYPGGRDASCFFSPTLFLFIEIPQIVFSLSVLSLERII